MNYENAFSGTTKNGYNAVCFKISIGNYYTIVLKDGIYKVYDDYTHLTGAEFDIAPFVAALSEYFEETKRIIEEAKTRAA